MPQVTIEVGEMVISARARRIIASTKGRKEQYVTVQFVSGEVMLTVPDAAPGSDLLKEGAELQFVGSLTRYGTGLAAQISEVRPAAPAAAEPGPDRPGRSAA